MDRLACALATAVLLVVAGVGTGCSSGGVVVAGPTPAAADAKATGGKVASRAEEKVDWNAFWEEMKSRGAQ
jgi:hypothetical protein